MSEQKSLEQRVKDLEEKVKVLEEELKRKINREEAIKRR